mgnify:CR=1 FL=1
MTQPDACIVRITGPEGKTRGTGFVICGDGRIATCAHVVEEMEPHVAFPGSEQRPAQVVAIDPVHDVAILKLEGELPPGAEAARLGNSAEGHYRNFRTRGYRPLGELQGIPAEGRVVQAVSECPGGLYLPLILKSQDIRKGMSGAPVYIPDADLVVVGSYVPQGVQVEPESALGERQPPMLQPGAFHRILARACHNPILSALEVTN